VSTLLASAYTPQSKQLAQALREFVVGLSPLTDGSALFERWRIRYSQQERSGVRLNVSARL
jgi:hypothetical protein